MLAVKEWLWDNGYYYLQILVVIWLRVVGMVPRTIVVLPPSLKMKMTRKLSTIHPTNHEYYSKSGGYMAKIKASWMVYLGWLRVDGMLQIKPSITKLNQSTMPPVHLEKS